MLEVDYTLTVAKMFQFLCRNGFCYIRLCVRRFITGSLFFPVIYPDFPYFIMGEWFYFKRCCITVYQFRHGLKCF